uniref:ATPase AAA-type core domain-containing protein n=1 Tax=viral metagenome TaxID=1070528 RepID=A0A6C0AZI7_9ZZZZ
MVKLIFKPDGKTDNVVESKTSKKQELNLNPFKFNESPDFEVTETKPEGPFANCVKDLVGLENCAYVLNDWYLNKSDKLLLIIGPVGCGKTSLVEFYCKENSIQLYTVKTTETIKTKKELLRDIITFSVYSSTSFFIKKGNGKKLILIDEYQNGPNDLLSITDINNLSSGDLKELSTVYDVKGGIVLPPILIISGDSKGTKLSDLKKTHEVYYINEIPNYILKPWITKISKNSPEILNEILKKCKSDKRLILHTLEFLKNTGTNNIISFIENFYIDVDVNIFDFINLLFDNSELSLDEIFKVYDTDGFLLSNLVYENYLDYNQDIHAVANSSEAISFGETIFSDTYESTKSFIPDAHCLNAMCIPRYHSKDDRPNKNVRSSCLNNRFNIFLNNKKTFKKISESNSLDIYDIFILKKFVNQSLIKTKILSPTQELFIKNIIGSLNGNGMEKMEFIYKHFSEFDGKDSKTKNFTLKFKEKINKLIN